MYKNVLIEDDQKNKFFPVTTASNVLLNDLKTSLNKEMVNILNEIKILKEFKNEVNDSLTEVSNADEEIRKLSEDIDEVKRYGVEINKKLVGALNSKYLSGNVKASTNKTINNNIELIKNIERYKYMVGDTINKNNLKKYLKPKEISNLNMKVHDLEVDKNNYIYVLTNFTTIVKMNSSGSTLWEKRHSSSEKIRVHGDKIYSINSDRLTVFNSSGQEINSFKLVDLLDFETDDFLEIKDVVAIGNQIYLVAPSPYNHTTFGLLYCISDNKIKWAVELEGSGQHCRLTTDNNNIYIILFTDYAYRTNNSYKYSTSGNKLWSKKEIEHSYDIKVHNGYLYLQGANYTTKRDLNGNIIWQKQNADVGAEIREKSKISLLSIDNNNNVYSGNNILRKLNSSGLEQWRYKKEGSSYVPKLARSNSSGSEVYCYSEGYLGNEEAFSKLSNSIEDFYCDILF